MNLLCFSDIHHIGPGGYPGGIMTRDVIAIEERFTDLAYSLQVDACLFGGDRFLKHNPEDEVRVLADREQKRRNDLGLVTFSLVGNHDWWGKGASTGHSNRQSQMVWGQYLPNLVIMDEAKTYRHPRLPLLSVHALPACIDPDMGRYEFSHPGKHILLFHGMVKGCLLDDRNEYRSPEGIDVHAIDDPRFDVILGGDIHLPQRLAFKNSRGGYIGSCVQQSRRDRGEDRIFMGVKLDMQGPEVELTMHDSGCPRFVDVPWPAAKGYPTEQGLQAYLATVDEDPARAIVTLFLEGSPEAVAALGPAPAYPGIRRLSGVRRQPTLAVHQPGPAQPLAPQLSPGDAFARYLDRPGLNVGHLNRDKLYTRALGYLNR